MSDTYVILVLYQDDTRAGMLRIYLSDDVFAFGDGVHAGDELQQDYSEAVDVALVSEFVSEEILGVHVPRRALHHGGDMARSGALHVRHWRQARQSEVRHFRHLPVVQQYVARLDVSMENWRIGLRVQIQNSTRRPKRNPQPRRKVQRYP